MLNEKTLKVSPSRAAYIEQAVESAGIVTKKDDSIFDEEVVFPDGRRMAIQVIAPGDPSAESCWTQGVLFSPDGHELGCTDVGESFLGEYQVTYEDIDYVTFVEEEK